MALSDYIEDKVINWFRGTAFGTAPTTIYLALFTTATTDAGGGTEVTGGDYARVAVTLAAPSPAGVTSNAADVTFPTASADWGEVTHVAVVDSASGAFNSLMHGVLAAPQTINSGDLPAKFLAGDLDLTLV